MASLTGEVTRPTTEGMVRNLTAAVDSLVNQLTCTENLIAGRDQIEAISDKEVPYNARRLVLCEMIEEEVVRIRAATKMVEAANEVLERQLSGIKLE